MAQTKAQQKQAAQAIPADVLDRAMRLFWQRGYYDTSIDALIAGAGLNRSAIYRHFGSKKQLFRALLEHYRDTVSAKMLAPLRAPDADLEAIRAFFRRLRALAETEQSRRGCLMVMTGSEVSTRERAIGRVVMAFMDEVRGLFAAALDRATTAGDLSPRVESGTLADYLLGVLVGFMTLARSPLPRAAVGHYIDEVLVQLDGLTTARQEPLRSA